MDSSLTLWLSSSHASALQHTVAVRWNLEHTTRAQGVGPLVEPIGVCPNARELVIRHVRGRVAKVHRNEHGVVPSRPRERVHAIPTGGRELPLIAAEGAVPERRIAMLEVEHRAI